MPHSRPRHDGRKFYESVDPVVAAGPDFFRDEVVNPDHQNIFVMRSIEDHNFAPGEGDLVCPPKKVVRQLFGGWLLERRHAAALRIHGTQDVVDCAVFASCVESLKADQQRMPALGVKQLLQLAQFLLVVRDLLGGGFVACANAFNRLN